MLSRRQFIRGLAAVPLAIPALSVAIAGTPMLRVRGAIGDGAGGDGLVEYDAAGFDALPQTRFVTSTPWHDTAVEFRGVSARDLLATVGARGDKLQLVALNDYVVDAEAADIVAGDGLFATHQNGVPMPVSDKGPVFLLFPFDDRPELRHQTYYSRSVWQLSEIVVAA